jgi:hypothetical protein
VNGRWATAITWAGLGVDVAGERLAEQVLCEVEVHDGRAVGVGVRHGPQRVLDDVALVELSKLEEAFTRVGDPPVDVHEGLDAVVAGGGVGDDRTAVGVADEDGSGRRVSGRFSAVKRRRAAIRPAERLQRLSTRKPCGVRSNGCPTVPC